MRFILRKYVDAGNASEALALDSATPVHDVYLKDGEEPKRTSEPPRDLIGFYAPPTQDLIYEAKKR